MTTEDGADKILVVIVDDSAETRENIRKLLQFESDMEVVGVARTGSEAIDVVTEAEPDVVLMDINMPDMDGITATEKIRALKPATQIIILSVQNDSNYMRRAMLAGARDFLTKPPNVDELISAIRRAGEMAAGEKAKQATTMAAVQAASNATGQLFFPGALNGKIITIFSPKGGTGTTTITANLAIELHSEETPVVVVDGCLQFGDLSFFFKEQGPNNVIDLASRPEQLDKEVVEDVLIEHEDSGVKILAGPPRPEQAEAVNGEDFGSVVKFLKSMFTYVLVDTNSGLDDATMTAIDVADLITIVTTQDIPSIKNVRLFLDLADALGIKRDQIIIAMNRFDKRRSTTADRVKEITKQDVVGIIPIDEKLVIPSTDRGVPFILENKNSGPGKGIRMLAKGVRARIKELDQTEAEPA